MIREMGKGIDGRMWLGRKGQRGRKRSMDGGERKGTVKKGREVK